MDSLSDGREPNASCTVLENGADNSMNNTVLPTLSTYLCSRDSTKCFTYIILFILCNILVSLGFDQRSRILVSNIRGLFKGLDLLSCESCVVSL